MENKTYIETKIINRLNEKYKERYGYLNCNTVGYISKKGTNKHDDTKSIDTSFRATDYLLGEE